MLCPIAPLPHLGCGPIEDAIGVQRAGRAQPSRAAHAAPVRCTAGAGGYRALEAALCRTPRWTINKQEEATVLSEKEEKIARMLEGRYGEEVAGAFRGGIKVLDHDNEDRVCQSAHSLREVLVMVYKQEKMDSKKEPKGEAEKDNKKGFAHNLSVVMNRVGQPTHDDTLYRKIAKNKERLDGIAHHSSRRDKRKYRLTVKEFEELLEELLAPHFNALDDVERLIKKQTPTKSDFEELETLLSKNDSLRDYFFQNAGPEWLARLVEEGYFSRSHRAKGGDGGAILADRTLAGYLAGCAKEMPELAAGPLASMLEAGGWPQDPIVQLHAVRAALAMPPDHALRIARQVRPGRQGHPLHYSVAVQEVGELAVHLAGSHAGDAVKLAGTLLSVTSRVGRTDTLGGLRIEHIDVVPVVGSYYFGLALKDAVSRLFDKAPVQTTAMLVRRLARIIRMENTALPESERDGDASVYWRPAIEDHANNPPDFKSDLTGTLARLLVELGKRSIAELKEALRALAEKGYPVFRRIELHVYRALPEAFEDEINAAVGACFGRREMKHEYFWLLRGRFRHLPEAVRRGYLDRVAGGPGEPYVQIAGELEREGRGPPPDEAVRRWKVDRLAPVRDQLTEAEMGIVGDAVREDFRSACPDFVVQYGPARVGIDTTSLKKGLEPDAVMEALRSYGGRDDYFWNTDGTPERFQEYCNEYPGEYSKRAGELAGYHPRLRAALFAGLQAAAGKNADIDWDGVLGLCASTVKSVTDGGAAFGDETGALGTAAALLRTALSKDLIEHSKRDELWGLLEGMVMLGGEDDLSDEERAAQTGGDAASTIHNTVGGMTLLAAGEYAMWRSRHAGEKPGLAPEVKGLLDRYIGMDIYNTPSRHAAVGNILPLLYRCDKGWIQGRIKGVFGGGTGELTRAAWSGYLVNDPDWNSFGDMVWMYRAGVASPKSPSADDGGDFMPYSKGLINHVTQGHLLRMGEADGLFEDMSKNLNKSGRSHCAWIVYLILKAHNGHQCESFDSERLRSIWKDRRFAFNDSLSGWVEFSPLEPEETLELLHGSLEAAPDNAMPMFLLRELRPFADRHPEKVLACLEDVAYNESLHEEIRFGGDDLQSILKALLKNRPTRRRATEVINRVGELGYNEYCALLGGDGTGA